MGIGSIVFEGMTNLRRECLRCLSHNVAEREKRREQAPALRWERRVRGIFHISKGNISHSGKEYIAFPKEIYRIPEGNISLRRRRLQAAEETVRFRAATGRPYRPCPPFPVGRVAERSEFEIPMIACGNHTMISQWPPVTYDHHRRWMNGVWLFLS